MSSAIAKPEATELAERVRPLLDKAKEIYSRILAGERGLERRRDAILIRAWQLGKVLAEIKEEVGHGRWLFWLGANWSDLSERSAQRSLALYNSNEDLSNPQNFADFEPDSVRKFMFGYVPAKERPQLTGDKQIPASVHPLTFVNQFTKWDRQAEIGLVTRPPVETLRRDLEPVLRRIVELTGKDWVETLLT